MGLGLDTVMRTPMRRRLFWIALTFVAVLAVLALFRLPAFLHDAARGLPYHDSFAAGKADEWKALGGTWEVVDGTMRNDSDERGAKLLTGSPYWQNYSIEADVMLLGQSGDAGLMVRSSNEEEGVDSYRGYYAGLRNLDNSLVLGRADHGWMEDNRKLDPIQGGIQPLQWYHLKLLAYECQIVVTASSPSGGSLTSTSISDKDCVRSGRVGLRSYSSGGVWKNVVVRSATPQDLLTMLGAVPSRETSAVQPSAAESPEILGFHSANGNSETQSFRLSANALPIGALRLASFSNTSTATVRGVVILTSPALFVQDSTGGVSVPHPNAPPLKVGDEVEVSGSVRPGDFSSTLEHATVRVLWARTPMPPVSVTASQAATGAFDANFIELDGYLRSKHYGPDNTLVFDFDAGPQAFRAIMNRGRGDFLFKKIKPNSLLRLRGICVVDSAYTHDLTPFVLLLPSTDDVEILAGPPWWSAGHLVALAIGLPVLALLVIFFYGLAERWRLHAVLEERERLAHEMHDTIAQSFAGIGFQLEAIRNGIPLNLKTSHQQLDLASDLVRHSHEEARRSIAAMRPESLGELLPALDACARRMVEGGAVEVLSNSSGDQRPLPVRITDTLYRIGQEAIANAIRHGHPSRLAIDLDFEKNVVHLTVSDDGIGFVQTRDQRGFGVRGMRKRAASISATLQILSAQNEGTRVRITASIPPRITLLSWPRFIWKYLMEHRPNAQSARQTYPNSYRG